MKRGFSTLEILLALTIMTTTLIAVVLVEVGTPSALADGTKEIAATEVATSMLMIEMQEGMSDFTSVTPIASTTSNNITSSVTVTPLPDGYTSLLTSTAAWIDVEGEERLISLHALVTDFLHVSENSPCSNVLGGDWMHPTSFTSSVSPGNLLPSGFTIDNPISALTLSSSTLVAAIGTTTTKSDPTLLLFSLSSTTQPSYLGSIDNATSTKQGVNSVAISGTNVFAANAVKSNFSTCKTGSSCAQLQIFDVSNPLVPTDSNNFELATMTAPFALGSEGQSIGKSITYDNGYVYLGLTKTSATNGEEFNIINVRNPRSPIWLGGYSVGRSINQIVVRGAYAYLATDDPNAELIILNIQNPENITLTGTYDAAGASTFGYGNTLAVTGNTLALGRTYTPNGPGLYLLSITTTSPQVLSSEPIASALNPINVQSVLLRDFILFVLTNNSVELFNIQNTTHPIAYGSPIALPSGSTGSSIACLDNTIYVSSIGNDQTGYLTAISAS
jgi:hypothetical protein